MTLNQNLEGTQIWMLDVCLIWALRVCFHRRDVFCRWARWYHSMQLTRACKNGENEWKLRLKIVHIIYIFIKINFYFPRHCSLTLGRGGTVLKSSTFQLPWYILLILSLALFVSVYMFEFLNQINGEYFSNHLKQSKLVTTGHNTILTKGFSPVIIIMKSTLQWTNVCRLTYCSICGRGS